MKDLKAQFPIFKNNPGLIYLDSASSTQKPLVVIDAERDFYENFYANVHRGLYRLSERSTELYENARKKIADFINADPNEVIFTKGATEGLNFLASSLTEGFGVNDVVLLTEMEHHANIVPWQKAAKKKRFELRFIPVDANGELDLSDAAKLFKDVRIVSFTHASNVLGTVNDVKKVAALARKAGAVVVLDAAQSISHMKIDVKELGVDFMVFSGHKVYGPTGIGVLYGRKTLLETLEPYQTGGEMVRSVTLEFSEWSDPPHRFEAGTPNIAGAIGLGAATAWIKENEALIDKTHLVAGLIKELRDQGAEIYGPDPEQRVALVSFNIPGVHPHDIASYLSEHNVAVRAGHHCAMPLHTKLGVEASARASLGVYNDENDIERFLEAVRESTKVLKTVK